MTNLILQLVLMISFAVIVYLMAIAVPRVEEDGDGSTKEKQTKHRITIHIDKLDAVLNKWKDKALRRIKIIVMKTDNYISRQLNKKEEKL
jgi:hypothetical protein